MQESGIYLNWLASYSNREAAKEKDIVTYQAAKIKHFHGLLVLCVILTGFAFSVIILEIVLKKKSSKDFVIRKNPALTKYIQINRETLRQNYLRNGSVDLFVHHGP